MTKYKTEQEEFWADAFGEDYQKRNTWEKHAKSNIAFFSRVLSRMGPIQSVIEFGANIGLNLRALNALCTDISMHAVEINKNAYSQLIALGYINAHHKSILEFDIKETFDLAFTKGVLIHIAPETLPLVYEKLYQATRKYILVAEYYNPKPVSIPYRGYQDRLFKRDFAGEILDSYPDLTLIDYGFVYHRDLHFPLDDINWFLLEK